MQGRFGQGTVMEPPVLDLDEYVQLQVLVPNIVMGVSDAGLGKETSVQILQRLRVLHNVRLSCKSWKTIVDRSVQYNALRLAEYDCKMWPNDVRRRFMTREYYIVTQFQENMKWFTKSQHITTRTSKKILRANLEDLTLQRLDVLQDTLKLSFYAVDVQGIGIWPDAQYWMCPADRA